VQFGKPISKFQAIQFKLADMLCEIEHAKLMVLKAAWEKDNGRDYVLTASLAKLYSGEISRKVVNEAVQIHGGYGFMDEYPVSRMYRDQKINEIGEGTNEVQRLVIARLMGL
jgi:short/branched chain acyl-CoA dehydrogenase